MPRKNSNVEISPSCSLCFKVCILWYTSYFRTIYFGILDIMELIFL